MEHFARATVVFENMHREKKKRSAMGWTGRPKGIAVPGRVARGLPKRVMDRTNRLAMPTKVQVTEEDYLGCGITPRMI
jgi:hypothetical protein